MGSRLMHPATERVAKGNLFNAVLARLFGAFPASDRSASGFLLARRGGKFTDALERDLDLRLRELQ